MEVSDKTPPNFELRVIGGIMIIYERELRLLGKSGSVTWVKAASRDVDGKLFWEIEVKLTGEKEHAHLVTSSNNPRQFPNLNRLTLFIAEICPNIESIEVVIKQSDLKPKPRRKVK